MLSRAYLVLRLKQDETIFMGICSDPSPTMDGFAVQGVVMQADGPDYARARAALVREIERRHPWVFDDGWLLKEERR
ncbi:MAG: hypothetical protein AABY22_23685 [Nanoarchaeota archaeon]